MKKQYFCPMVDATTMVMQSIMATSDPELSVGGEWTDDVISDAPARSGFATKGF